MGAFLWRLAARRIRFLVFPVPIIPAFRFNLTLPAFVVLPLWALQQLYYSSGDTGDSGVAFAAHVGGFLAGLAFAIAVTLLRVEETVVAPAIEQQISLEQNPGIERASEARLAGDLETARRTIRSVLQAEPENLDGWIESWEIALEGKHGEEAGRAGLRLLELLKRQRRPVAAASNAEPLPLRGGRALRGERRREGGDRDLPAGGGPVGSGRRGRPAGARERGRGPRSGRRSPGGAESVRSRPRAPGVLPSLDRADGRRSPL
jgi:hypothetical protein